MSKNKKEIIREIAEEQGLTLKEVTTVVDSFFEKTSEVLTDKDASVEVYGFGKFVITERSARAGINPVTKEKIDIPASNMVKFKPSKQLKDKVNGK